jgi:hypothetical protein
MSALWFAPRRLWVQIFRWPYTEKTIDFDKTFLKLLLSLLLKWETNTDNYVCLYQNGHYASIAAKARRDSNSCASDNVSSSPHTESHLYFSTFGWMSVALFFSFHFWFSILITFVKYEFTS